MKKQILLSLMLISSVSLFSCATMGGNSEQAAFDDLRSQTVAAADKAKSVRGEWRDIRKVYIGGADKAAKAGDYAKAMKLMQTAKFQAEKGYEQAMEQKSAGPRH